MKKNNNSNASISAIEILTIVFVVLKLTDVINWSWWWVLSPVWITIALIIIIAIILAIFD